MGSELVIKVASSGVQMSLILRKHSAEELQMLVQRVTSLSELMETLGYKSSGARTNVRRALIARGIDVSKFGVGISAARRSNECRHPSRVHHRKWTIETIHELSGSRTSHKTLIAVLLSSGRAYVCELCQNDGRWRSDKLVLELDHVNGDPTDHRPENLRFLCPNCHSQTTTYGFRGRQHSDSTKRLISQKVRASKKCAS